jgi:hypothetical protein
MISADCSRISRKRRAVDTYPEAQNGRQETAPFWTENMVGCGVLMVTASVTSIENTERTTWRESPDFTNAATATGVCNKVAGGLPERSD